MSMNSVPKLDKIFLRDFDLGRFYDGSIIAMLTVHSVHNVNFTQCQLYTMSTLHNVKCTAHSRSVHIVNFTAQSEDNI